MASNGDVPMVLSENCNTANIKPAEGNPQGLKAETEAMK